MMKIPEIAFHVTGNGRGKVAIFKYSENILHTKGQYTQENNCTRALSDLQEGHLQPPPASRENEKAPTEELSPLKTRLNHEITKHFSSPIAYRTTGLQKNNSDLKLWKNHETQNLCEEGCLEKQRPQGRRKTRKLEETKSLAPATANRTPTQETQTLTLKADLPWFLLTDTTLWL